MKKLPRDQYGYINGRGRSKYWGVTVTADERWMLSYHPVDSDTTHSASPVNFKLGELDIAHIAGRIYENGQSRAATEAKSFKIRSLDKKYIYWIRGNSIFRERYNSQSFVDVAPDDTNLFDLDEKNAATKKKEDIAKIAKSKTESEYVKKIARMITESELSESSCNALIRLIEAIKS